MENRLPYEHEWNESSPNTPCRNKAKSEVKLEPTVPLLAEPAWKQVEISQEELLLPFTSPACCSSALVGGKGSQLALLTQMSEKVSGYFSPLTCSGEQACCRLELGSVSFLLSIFCRTAELTVVRHDCIICSWLFICTYGSKNLWN